jgi:hypothetical protein
VFLVFRPILLALLFLVAVWKAVGAARLLDPHGRSIAAVDAILRFLSRPHFLAVVLAARLTAVFFFHELSRVGQNTFLGVRLNGKRHNVESTAPAPGSGAACFRWSTG